MPVRDWVKIRNVHAGSTTGGPRLLSDPDYVVKSQVEWGFNPSDVKQGEEEFIFQGERRVQLEIACDSFAAIIHKAVYYLDRCKRIGHHYEEFGGLSTDVQNMILAGTHEDGCTGDVHACETMNGHSQQKMMGDAHLMCIVWFEILPRGGEECVDEKDGVRKRKRRAEYAAQTAVNRVRVYAALVVTKAKSLETGFTFNDALNMVKKDNFDRVYAQPDTSKKKWEPGPKKPKTATDVAILIESDRLLHSEWVVTLDHWLDVGRAIINQRDCPWVAAWNSADANNIMQTTVYNDRIDPYLCAGDPLLKGTVLEWTRAEDFYSFELECCRRASDKCAQSTPKYPEQLHDTSYLRHHICTNGQAWPADMGTVRDRLVCAMQQLDIDEAHPELLGISFDYLPEEVVSSCIYQIDTCNIDGPRWMLQRPDLSSWWEHIQQFENTTQLGHSDAIVYPHSGLPVPFMNNSMGKMDNALESGALVYRPRSKKNNGAEVVFDNLLTPFHYAARNMAEMDGHHRQLVRIVRSPGVSAVKMRDSCTKLLPHHVLLCRQMRSMLMLRHDQTVPLSTRNVCSYISDEENGFLGKMENLIRRPTWRRLAPDMEPGCNAMGSAHIMLEQLGCSSMHSTCYLVFLAVLQTMASKKGLSINPCLHGLGGAGKTYALVKTVKKYMVIRGTMVVEGYSSRLAMLGVTSYKIDEVVLIDEGLDYVLNSSDSGPSNVGLGDSTLKLRLSECVISSKTLTHIDGRKVTVTQNTLVIGSMIFLTNAGSLARSLGQALLDRMYDVEIPCVCRKHKGITDKIAADSSDNGSDHVRGNISSNFQHEVGFAWLLGKASTFFGFVEADMSAFAPVCKQYEVALASFGVKLSPRDITRAAMIAQQRALGAVYFDEFCCPHGRMTGFVDATVERIFDPQHTIESALIVSEAMAISSMGMILSKYNRGMMSKVAQAIVFLLHQSIHKYSTMFAASSTMMHGDETCLVDLNFVRFTVKKDIHGLRQFAALVANALADTSGNAITTDQVLDVLDEIEKLGEIEHKELDMLIDQSGSRFLNQAESLFKFSVQGWKRRSAHASTLFDPKWLDDTKNLYRNADKADKWQYWPQETTGPNVRTVNTRAIITDEVRVTGQIKISTAFLNAAQRPDFARDFESKVAQALNTSYTTERIIAKQPTDIMSTNPETPYMVPTARTRTSEQQVFFTNQEFISQEHYDAAETGDRPAHRSTEIIYPLSSVSIDSQAAMSRLSKLSQQHPTVLPSAHAILHADPSGVSARFGPHVLDCMLKESHDFRELVKKPDNKVNFSVRKKLAYEYLKKHYPDLMRHQHKNRNVQTTPEANLECHQYTLKVAHVVAEMSFALRMGDMRRRALISENQDEIKKDIKMAKQIRKECVAANNNMLALNDRTGNKRHDRMVKRLRYSNLNGIDLHLKLLKSRNRQTVLNEGIATANSGTNSDFNSFIEEWRSIDKPGAHGGNLYIHLIRTNGARMMDEREARDGKWTKFAATVNPQWAV